MPGQGIMLLMATTHADVGTAGGPKAPGPEPLRQSWKRDLGELLAI